MAALAVAACATFVILTMTRGREAMSPARAEVLASSAVIAPSEPPPPSPSMESPAVEPLPKATASPAKTLHAPGVKAVKVVKATRSPPPPPHLLDDDIIQ